MLILQYIFWDAFFLSFAMTIALWSDEKVWFFAGCSVLSLSILLFLMWIHFHKENKLKDAQFEETMKRINKYSEIQSNKLKTLKERG
ncbi:MAG: hypothetical protein V2A54_14140 [Bacteroidota bacterium]